MKRATPPSQGCQEHEALNFDENTYSHNPKRQRVSPHPATSTEPGREEGSALGSPEVAAEGQTSQPSRLPFHRVNAQELAEEFRQEALEDPEETKPVVP